MKKTKEKILVVDDIQINRLVLHDLFADEYDVLEAANGREALDIISQDGKSIAVVLLDLVMPEVDGFDVLKSMNASGIIKFIPVILITGEKGDEETLKGYNLGVSDVVNKPFNAEIVYRRVNNVIDLYAHKNDVEAKLEESREKLAEQDLRLKRANRFLIDALSTTVEFRNFESGEHVKRMRNLTQVFLMMMNDDYGFSSELIETIADASVLHDIGKIAIPDSVLLKPGPLTKDEFQVMKTHTLQGCDILESLSYVPDQEYYNYCYEICRHHHERWDGSGYPDGLKGDEISVWAQAASLADVYDALTSDRVYKKAYSHDEAVAMILRGDCGVFNPHLLGCFRDIQQELPARVAEIYKKERAQ